MEKGLYEARHIFDQLGGRSWSIITSTKGEADIRSPVTTPPDEVWRYGLAFSFQIAPRKAALFCNIRRDYVPVVDFETGTDIILFDAPSNIHADEAIPISRSHEEPDPDTGESCILVKYPVIGGFVPLGAKHADGSPHPHAGTGFGVGQVHSSSQKEIKLQYKYPEYRYDEIFQKHLERSRQFKYKYLELFQFAYDGKKFQVLNIERMQISPSWRFQAAGLMNAIPDGDDLLFAMQNADAVSGIARWRRDERGWRPISFLPVKGAENTGEASLVRDVDGAWLFTARGGGKENKFNIRLWRSYDGASWEQVVNVDRVRSEAPVSLNQAADGTPYIAANLYQEPFNDSKSIGSFGRENLCVWPLNERRTGLDAGIIVRACRAEFGPPPGGTYWMVDHPSATTVQLADGAWHNILAYRIAESGEIMYGGGPTPQTGCYVEEVLSSGQVIPPWNF